jgi:hypothetical protein
MKMIVASTDFITFAGNIIDMVMFIVIIPRVHRLFMRSLLADVS